jgi:DNA-binding NtrC family response regulator
MVGHKQGAFTGAVSPHDALARQAASGVLFLAEFTEMETGLQARLLRFLEDGEVRPVGASSGFAVNVRIIAATNRNPERAVRAGLLREDLYFRLNVVRLELPPLRWRRQDLPVLVHHFLALAAKARLATAQRQISDEAIARLATRRWPGNVRELRNEVLRLDALCHGDRIEADLVGAEPHDSGQDQAVGSLADAERQAIERALAATGGNRAAAARRLGIPRRTLYSKLKRYFGR